MDWEASQYVVHEDLGGVYVERLQSDKLGPKSDKCVFVRYPKETKGYYFYNPTENKVFVARTRKRICL